MPPLKFDPEATVEEIAGLGRNSRFDAVIDDKEDESLQVICKRGEDEIPLANPARAFYFGDRVLYDQEARRFDLGEKQQVLNTDQFPRNEKRFDELKRACQRGFVIPFVGAGMSKGAGCPEWKKYLLKLHGNLDNAAERVLNRAEYDEAYGNDGNIHFDCPVPKLLRRLYTSFSFLFLGCSLTYDRTIQTFTKVAQDVGADALPHHYAILACPDDEGRKADLERRLADAHISAIWFPEGDFHLIEEMLDLLMV